MLHCFGVRSVIAGAALLASCASYTTSRPVEIDDASDDWRRLPYHVALIPIHAGETARSNAGAERNGAPFAYSFRDLAHDAEGGAGPVDPVTESLVRVLQANTFSSVTVLPPPTTDELALLGDAGIDAYWAAAAREAKADLLLDVDSFEYPIRPDSHSKWYSYVLFLTGPLELLFPDRTYQFDDMSLGVTLYEVSELGGPLFPSRNELVEVMRTRGEGGDLGEARERAADAVTDYALGSEGGVLRQFRVRPEDIEFRFGDRLGRGMDSGSFWTSLFVPSTLLEKNSEHFSDEVTEVASLTLAQDLAREIAEGDYEYIVRPRTAVGDLTFDAQGASLVRSGRVPDALELRAGIRNPQNIGPPRLRIGAAEYDVRFVEDLTQFPISWADVEADLGPMTLPAYIEPTPEREDGMDHQLIVLVPGPDHVSVGDAALADGAPADVVQLFLTEGSGNRTRSQSWTFGLEAALTEPEILALVQRTLPPVQTASAPDDSPRALPASAR